MFYNSPDVVGSIVKNGDGTYTLTYKDGRSRKFDTSGKLLWQKDRDGNQTTLSYTSSVLSGITDATGSSLSVTIGSNGRVSQISDTTGVVATYDYFTSTNQLKTVTYADGSKYKFEYDTTAVSGKVFLKTVKDALDNVLETHDYDSSGRATTSEKDGSVEEYTIQYDQSDYSYGNFTRVTDGLGRETKYYFQRRYAHNIVTRTEGVCSCGGGGSETTRYYYDENLNLVKKTDALGNNIVYTYDSQRNVTSIEDALGIETFSYNSMGQVLIARNKMGGVTANTYDSLGNLLTTTLPVAASTPNSVAITWTNKAGVAESPTGTITRNTGTDSWGVSGASSNESLSGDGTLRYVVAETNKDRMIGLGYVDSDQSYTDIDFAIHLTANGYTTVYQNGAYTQPFPGYSTGTVIEIERVGTTIKYKKDGTVLRTTTGVSTAPLYVDTNIYANGGTFSGVALLTASTSSVGNTTTMTYTSAGQLASLEDARGKITEFDYNSSKQLVKITDANANETDFTYNARAKVTSVTNALNQTTSFDYDAKDRLETITYPDTSEVNFDYDLAGRRTSVTDELGHATTYAYDNAYRMTSVTDALSNATSFGYDAMSNLTSQTDALGNVTAFEYNDFNRVKKVVYPAPSPSATPLNETFTYDTNGNLKTKVDTGGRTTSYDYDTSNRMTKITDALSKQTQFTYNPLSQMTKVKDALNQEYTFTYDQQGRVLTQTRNGTTMTFTYDAVGNRATRTDYLGHVTSYTYDDLNRLTNVGYTGASGENASYTYDDLSRLLTAVNAAGTVTFTYDNRGRLKTEEDVFGHDLEYTYDAAGRRTLLKLDTANHTGYSYDNANRLTTLTDESSNNFTFGYDNANRRTSRVMPNGITSTYTYDNMSRLKRLKHEDSSTTLYDDQFTYDASNQISQIAGLSQTRTFTHDNTDRLTAVDVGSTTVESYAYDSVGNRTSSHLSSGYTTGSFNRITATSLATYAYNNSGSMTGETVGSVNWAYGWDRENRMVSAGDGTNSVSYQYDGLGRRVKRTQGSNVEKYTHDGPDVSLDDTNSTLTKYQNSLGVDNKLKLAVGGTSKYFLSDHLGSIVMLANSSGASLATNGYDSFGNSTNGSFASRYQYTGRELDPLTGLNFYRARWQDPELGRFISEDPIGFRGGDVNLYGYVKNGPISHTDPSGLDGVAVWQNPFFWPGAAGGAGALGGLALNPVPWVVGGGFAAGYGIGYYPGQWWANNPYNPMVAGPLNPFKIWDKLWQPTPYPAGPTRIPTTVSGPACQPMPKAIPWRNDWPPIKYDIPLGPYPPQTPELHEKCMDRCEHLIGIGDNGAQFQKCYRRCTGRIS